MAGPGEADGPTFHGAAGRPREATTGTPYGTAPRGVTRYSPSMYRLVHILCCSSTEENNTLPFPYCLLLLFLRCSPHSPSHSSFCLASASFLLFFPFFCSISASVELLIPLFHPWWRLNVPCKCRERGRACV